MTVYTIGHSTRPAAEFLALLKENGIEQLVDVRTVPKSRHNPQFNSDALGALLTENGIEYVPMKELGGLRKTVSDSVNTGWKNASFRGFADYMQTPEFSQAIGALVQMAEQKRIAIMCAEAVPWRCHRSLISDALLIRGLKVQHILGKASLRGHSLTSFAEVAGNNVKYPSS